MSQAATPAPLKKEDDVESVIVVSYPKIIFLYPTLIFGFITALSRLSSAALDPHNKVVVVMNTLFLGIFAINLVVLAFDFRPRRR